MEVWNMGIDRIIATALKLGMGFWLAGQLSTATMYFARESAKEMRHGLISLSQLNHALLDDSAERRAHHEK
jgi:hypothetical protein